MQFVFSGQKFMFRYCNCDALVAGAQQQQLAIGKSCKLGGNLQYDGPALTSEYNSIHWNIVK